MALVQYREQLTVPADHLKRIADAFQSEVSSFAISFPVLTSQEGFGSLGRVRCKLSSCHLRHSDIGHTSHSKHY